MNLFILFLSQSFLSFLYFVFSLFFFMVVQPRSWSSHEFMVPFWWNPHILISSTILDQKEPGLSGGVDFVFGQKQKTRVGIRCHRDHQGHLEMWKESQGEGAKIVTSIKKKTRITVTGIDWVGARPWVQDDVQKVQITDSMPKINHVPSLSQLIGAWFAAWDHRKVSLWLWNLNQPQNQSILEKKIHGADCWELRRVNNSEHWLNFLPKDETGALLLSLAQDQEQPDVYKRSPEWKHIDL